MERVAELWTEITEHHARLDPFFRQRSDAQGQSELRGLLNALERDPDAAIFVYALGESEAGDAARQSSGAAAPAADLAGLCIVRIDHAPPILEETERAEITDLGVREVHRRRGVASQLLEAALAWVRAAEVERVEVQVASGNPEGQAFWRARGFGDLMDVLHKRL